VKKMPLGKIKRSQILAGYSVLSQIAEMLQTAESFKQGIKDRGLQNVCVPATNLFVCADLHFTLSDFED
jgi:Poly(ADP-ribose) polymerase, regulatory domain